MNLKPFFTYFGGKYRAAPRYPAPQYESIVEPFAGAAGYSLRYYQLGVTLYDKDPIIAGLWSYLVRVRKSEILALPTEVSHVDDVKGPQEARWLVGFWFNKGSTGPRLSPSMWCRGGTRPDSYWGSAIRERIASQVGHIKHWKIVEGSYWQSPDVEATWFIDPPYDGPGNLYRHKIIDYPKLGRWCQSRRGQVMVCEKEGATWLPFEPFAEIKSTEGTRGKGTSKEAIWLGGQMRSVGN